MGLHRSRRRWLSVWLIAALLCLQMAAAAYACPRIAAHIDAAGAMAEMDDCVGGAAAAMDPEQPQLCRLHCEPGTQTLSPTLALDFASVPVLVAVLDWRPAFVDADTPPMHGVSFPAGAPPPGSPPLYLSLLVLRN